MWRGFYVTPKVFSIEFTCVELSLLFQNHYKEAIYKSIHVLSLSYLKSVYNGSKSSPFNVNVSFPLATFNRGTLKKIFPSNS